MTAEAPARTALVGYCAWSTRRARRLQFDLRGNVRPLSLGRGRHLTQSVRKQRAACGITRHRQLRQRKLSTARVCLGGISAGAVYDEVLDIPVEPHGQLAPAG